MGEFNLFHHFKTRMSRKQPLLLEIVPELPASDQRVVTGLRTTQNDERLRIRHYPASTFCQQRWPRAYTTIKHARVRFRHLVVLKSLTGSSDVTLSSVVTIRTIGAKHAKLSDDESSRFRPMISFMHNLQGVLQPDSGIFVCQ